jgi:hypothetical protein
MLGPNILRVNPAQAKEFFGGDEGPRGFGRAQDEAVPNRDPYGTLDEPTIAGAMA